VDLRLRPLRDDEFDDYVSRGRASYARDMIDQAGIPEEAARAKAEHDWKNLLPKGLSSPGQFLFALEDTATGERVGDLWLAERDSDFGKGAFIYSIEIFEAFRGRGFGRQAMLALDGEVRSRGLSRVSLNVFGGNDVARSLYRSVGYTETAVFMSKEL
jgi:ribosomal protein S18 acetylase RimI-like enzyme